MASHLSNVKIMKDKKEKSAKPLVENKVEEIYETFIVDETSYKTLLNPKYLKRTTYIKPDPKKILSVIPGTVIKILVEPGQKLKPGETIVVLEAMKMMNNIILPKGGTIKKLNVKKGQVIPKKFLIAELK